MAGSSARKLTKADVKKAQRRITSVKPTVSIREAIEDMRPLIERQIENGVRKVDIVTYLSEDLNAAPTTIEYYLQRKNAKKH